MDDNATVETELAGPGTLHPETQKSIGSMSDKFREAMSDSEPKQDDTPPPKPVETTNQEDQGSQAAEPEKESRSAKDFKLIKQERDEAKKLAEELKAKSAEMEEKMGLYSDYDKLKEENQSLNEVLAVTNLEKHPKFREKFVTPINDQIERAMIYVPEDSREQLAKVLKMPIGEGRAEALDGLTSELPPSRQAYLQSVINRIDEISFERDKQLENSKESYEKALEDDRRVSEQKKETRDKELGKTFDKVLKDAQENIGVFQLREGDEEWNTGVRERVSLAKNILMEQNSFEDAATAALWAASGGALLEQNAALVEHNRRMTEELSKLKQAEPNPSGSSPAKSATRPAPDGDSFTSRVLGELKDLRG